MFSRIVIRYVRPSGILGGVLTLSLACALPARADEPFLEFVHALQERGYGDMAVAQLERFQAQEDTPKEVKEVLQWELSKSYRIWAEHTKDATQAQQRLAESQKLFELFEKNNPDHPATAESVLFDGDAAFERGRRLLAQALATEDKAAQAKLRTDAQTEFKTAQVNFDKAAARYRKWLDNSPPPEAQRSERRRSAADALYEQMEQGWTESKLKLAAAGYFGAQTLDAQSPERKKMLEEAAAAFDAIYQLYRDYETGLRAHLWHGKVAEELGNKQLAEDIYDEVLASETEDSTRNTDLAWVYGQGALWRMELLMDKETPASIAQFCDEWLEARRLWRLTEPYQGIALHGAKAKLALAANETPIKKDRLTKEALNMLAAIAKIDSEFQREAIELRRQNTSTGTTTAGSFDEQIEIANTAAELANWQEAVTAYGAAFARTDVPKDAERLAEIKRRFNFCRLRYSQTLYEAKSFDECINTASLIVRDDPTDASAAPAASLAAFAAAALYDAAPEAEKAAALDRLRKIAEFNFKTWPQGPAADDANIALGQVQLRRGEFTEGLASLEKVQVKSPRYPTAASAAGRVYWRNYLLEKRKPDDQRDSAAMEQNRTKAYEMLKNARNAQTAVEVGAPEYAEFVQTNLMLAEICLEGDNTEEAAQLLAPLLKPLEGAKRETLEDWEASVLMSAIRAYSNSKEWDKASSAALTLASAQTDNPKVNALLTDFCRVLREVGQEAQATEPAASSESSAPAEAPPKVEDARLRELIGILAKRQQLTPVGMTQLAEYCIELGLEDDARNLCQRVLDKADQEPDFAKSAANVVTRARAQMVSLLRSKGQVAEAAKQVEELLKTHPKALDLHMLKGEILEAEAEKDPKRYDECVAHWTRLRLSLAQARPRPDEYYEVVYNAANCLVKQSQAVKDKEKAQQAEQLLKATLTLTPELSGPDMKAQYEALLAKAHAAQGAPKPNTKTAKAQK